MIDCWPLSRLACPREMRRRREAQRFSLDVSPAGERKHPGIHSRSLRPGYVAPAQRGSAGPIRRGLDGRRKEWRNRKIDVRPVVVCRSALLRSQTDGT
ncbi:hypothetical protein HN011_006498 [Eciton burchellii]|nr:hypothetical protein HN011_006498 [Eciton burchellii]